MRPLDLVSLKKLVWQHFDDNTISTLCEEIGFNEKDLPNKGMIEKSNHLIERLVKEGRAKDVFNAIYKMKPELIEDIFYFDENIFLTKEVLLRDPSLISVPLEQAGERIVRPQADDPNANTLLKKIDELNARLEVLADSVSQEKLFSKLEEASQIVRSKWSETEYWQKIVRAQFLINSASAEIFRLDKQRELRVADVNYQIELENKVRQDEIKLTWIIPSIISFYTILVVAVTVLSISNGVGDLLIPLINIPLSVLVWSAIGSLSALIYRYYRRIKRASLIPEIRLTFGKFWIGLISGAIFYFAVRSGLFILSSQQVDINQSPLGQQQLMWVLVWLISFSDFVFERVITRISGNVVGEESDKTVSSVLGVNISDISDTIEKSNSKLLSELRRLRAQTTEISVEQTNNKEAKAAESLTPPSENETTNSNS